MGFDFEVEGIEDYHKALQTAIRKAPDIAEDRLRKLSLRFRRAVVKKTKERTKEHSGKLTKGYKLGKIEGRGIGIHRDFVGKAPHFHLVEKGHNKVYKGKNVGWVEGKFMVADTIKEFGDEVAKETIELLNDILEAGDLT